MLKIQICNGIKYIYVRKLSLDILYFFRYIHHNDHLNAHCALEDIDKVVRWCVTKEQIMHWLIMMIVLMYFCKILLNFLVKIKIKRKL